MKRLCSLILVLVMIISLPFSASAITPEEDLNPDTRISYTGPAKYLDISKSFTDGNPNANGLTGTCYSDYYFDCGTYKAVTIVGNAMTANVANDYITIQAIDRTTGNVIEGFTVNTAANMTFNHTFTKFSTANQNFYLRIFINSGTYH